ncbi:MAG: RNA polymerase sigma factor [Candidatus Cryptobacteroides sp.]
MLPIKSYGLMTYSDSRNDSTFKSKDGKEIHYSVLINAVDSYLPHLKSRHHIIDTSLLNDIRQDALMKIVRSAGSYDSTKGTPDVWARRIARNCAIDAFKYNSRNVHSVPELCDEDHGPDYIISGREGIERIFNLINSLKNEKFRIALTMKSSGNDNAEIAKILGTSVKNATTIVCRARAALKKKLGKEYLSMFGIA